MKDLLFSLVLFLFVVGSSKQREDLFSLLLYCICPPPLTIYPTYIAYSRCSNVSTTFELQLGKYSTEFTVQAPNYTKVAVLLMLLCFEQTKLQPSSISGITKLVIHSTLMNSLLTMQILYSSIKFGTHPITWNI